MGGHQRNEAVTNEAVFDLLIEMGLVPGDTRRVVIDCQAGALPVIYVEQLGTTHLLEVLRAFSQTTTVIHHMQPEQSTGDEKGNDR